MSTVVDTLFLEFSDILKILDANEEISLRNTLESNFKKTLLLSAASFFEAALTQHVAEFCAAISRNNLMLCHLVRSKAIERQYHTWFDWNASNANRFFSLFGDGCKSYATMGWIDPLRISWRLAAQGIAWFMKTMQAFT